MTDKVQAKLRILRGRLTARKVILESDIAGTRRLIDQMESQWYRGYMSAQLTNLSKWRDETVLLLAEVSEIIEEAEND